MIVSLTDYPEVVAVETFTVKSISTDDCAFDVISFGEDFSSETYVFTLPVNTKVFDPLVSQTVDNCPRQCTFYENTEPLASPSLFVSSANPFTGVVEFSSGSTYLDGSVFCILVVCESLDSEMPESDRIAYDRFTVRFEIDCSADNIAFVQDYTAIDYYITEDALPV